MGFGSAWTRSVIVIILKSFGIPEKPRGIDEHSAPAGHRWNGIHWTSPTKGFTSERLEDDQRFSESATKGEIRKRCMLPEFRYDRQQSC